MAEGGVVEGLLGAGEAESREGEQGPVAADAVAAAIALDQAEKDEGVAAEASAFLRSQKQLVDLQLKHFEHERRLAIEAVRLKLWTDRLKAVVQAVIAAAVVIVVLLIGWTVVDAARSRSVFVEGFHSSPSLSARGLDGEVTAQAVLDGLTHMQRSLRTDRNLRSLTGAWAHEVKIEVPDAGVSVGEIGRLLRERLGHDTHISGDLVQEPDGRLTLTVRGDGIEAKSFTGAAESFQDLTRQAAEYVLGSVDPLNFVNFLHETGREQDALAFLKVQAPPLEPGDRAQYLGLYGDVLISSGDFQNGIAKLKLAIQVDPKSWRAWSNLFTGLREQGLEEEAWRYFQRQAALIATLPESQKPPGWSSASGWTLTQDWPDFTASEQNNASLAGGRGIIGVSPASVSARAFTEQHDWPGAETSLTLAVSDDGAAAYVGALMEERRALEAGRLDQAAAAAEKAEALMTINMGHSFPGVQCWIGLAYDLAGQAAKAQAVYAGAPNYVACAAFKADGLEHRGDRRGADVGYARAVAIAPDLPFAYQRWGLTLLARGDLGGAKAKFADAHDRGEHWADPFKGLGDAAARQSHWRDALAFYNEALKDAPNWIELRRARDEAARLDR